jgi:hypothetical protein
MCVREMGSRRNVGKDQQPVEAGSTPRDDVVVMLVCCTSSTRIAAGVLLEQKQLMSAQIVHVRICLQIPQAWGRWPSVFGHNLQCELVRNVDTREQWHPRV